MTKQMTKIAIMLVLAVSAATAQDIKDGGLTQVGIYNGVETTKGTVEPMSTMQYGNTYVLNSLSKEETYHLTVSLDNYLTGGEEPLKGILVVSGSWSLVVCRDKAYIGTLYGEVTNGFVRQLEDKNGEIAFKQIQINLRSTGGLGIFNGKEGENISGVYNAITDLSSKETTGIANFKF